MTDLGLTIECERCKVYFFREVDNVPEHDLCYGCQDFYDWQAEHMTVYEDENVIYLSTGEYIR